MKKFHLMFLMWTSSLSAAPQAVVFDYGGVLAVHQGEVVSQFLCDTFQLTPGELETAKQNRKSSGDSPEVFWEKFAALKGIILPDTWRDTYQDIVKQSLGVDQEMYKLVEELKEKEIKVGLLSNIEPRWADVVQSYGLFQPFNPCLIAYDIGVEKPDPKAYQIMLERMNLNPNDVVFIDDQIENVEAAKECGIDAIVFQSAGQVRGELERRGVRGD